MKTLNVTLAACAVALTACSPPAATTTTSGEQATPAETAAPAEGIPTREQLIGTWGDNGDCTATTTFNADGTFAIGDQIGTWTLDGDLLTMTGAGGAFERRVAIGNENTLFVGSPDGSYGMSQRC